MIEPLKTLSGAVPARGATSIQPADNWEFAFVSGNGRMGAMVFGDPANETIVANHCRLFLPLGSRETLPDMAPHLPELRRIIREEGYDAAAGFFLAKAQEQGFPGLMWTDSFHHAFEMMIRQSFEGTAKDYLRTEDFQTGEVAVAWHADAGAFRRRLFVSRPDNVIVLSLTGPAPGSVTASFNIPLRSFDMLDVNASTGADWITYHNIYTAGKGGYDAVIRIVTRGGTTKCDGGTVCIEGADEVLLLMRIEPFAQGEPGQLEQIKAALAKLPANYEQLLEPHAREHAEIFNRVKLDLDGGAGRERSSEELIETAAREKSLPPALLEKMYDAGRYMFICSSDELPPNLQGMWTGVWNPPWSGDFTLDTNIQAAVGSAFSTNMLDRMEGYFRFIESLVPDWRQNARKLYGCRGVLSCTRASNTGLHLHWGDWPGEFWTAGAGWLAHWFYDHYRYTGDRDFLANRTVPLLKEIAAFYEDFLVEDENGTYCFIPSYSPETGCGINATMDVGVAREVLSNLIAGCEELSIERDAIPKWKAMLEKMPPYHVNELGELAEWATPGCPEHYSHRHCSPLYPVFQSFEFTPEQTPELWEAARRATRKKIEADEGNSSFGRMQSGMAAAYLGMAEEAYRQLSVMAIGKSMYPSLITSHEPGQRIFNVDANGSIPELLNMMIVFSWPGRLDLLPALPKALPRGILTGIMARGRIHIDRLEWNRPEGRIDIELTSRIAQTITVRLPAGTTITSAEVTDAGAAIEESDDGPNCRRLALPAGRAVRLRIEFAN